MRSQALHILLVLSMTATSTVAPTLLGSVAHAQSIGQQRELFALLQQMPEELRELILHSEMGEPAILSMDRQVLKNLISLAQPNPSKSLRNDKFLVLAQTLSKILEDSKGSNLLTARDFADGILTMLAKTPESTIAAHEIAILHDIAGNALDPQKKTEVLLSQVAIMQKLKDTNQVTLENYVKANGGNFSSEIAVGVAALDWIYSTTAETATEAKNYIESIIGSEKIAAAQEYIETAQRTAAFEKENFVRKIQNNPVYLAQTAAGIGGLFIGAATGNVIMAASSFWGLFGDRISTYLPVNQAILWVTRKAFETEGRQDLINKASELYKNMTAEGLVTSVKDTVTNLSTNAHVGRAIDCAQVGVAVCVEKAEEAAAKIAQVLASPEAEAFQKDITEKAWSFFGRAQKALGGLIAPASMTTVAPDQCKVAIEPKSDGDKGENK